MTDRLEEIRKRCNAATLGPWFPGDAQWLMNVNTHGDAQFIAHSREDIPYLLSELEKASETKRMRLGGNARLIAELEQYKKALELACEEIDDSNYSIPLKSEPQYWLDKAKEVKA